MPTFEEMKNIGIVLIVSALAAILNLVPGTPLELRTAAVLGAIAMATSYQGSRFTAKGLMQSVQTLGPSVTQIEGDVQKLSPEAMAVISAVQSGKSPTLEQLTAIGIGVQTLAGDLQKAAPIVQAAMK